MFRHTHPDTLVIMKTHETHSDLWPCPPYWSLFRVLPGQSALWWPQRLGLGRRCRGVSAGLRSVQLWRQRPAWASECSLQIKTPGSQHQRHLLMVSTHPCLRLCLLRSSLSPILPRDGERVRAPLGLLELRRVPVCLKPFREQGERWAHKSYIAVGQPT